MARKNSAEEEFLTCYICYDVFKEPKTLSCLHRFCERCLHSYIIGQKSQILIRHGGFQCPVCREMIKSPNAKRPPSDWASLLKTDFYLKNLIKYIENKGQVASSPRKATHPCSKHKENESDLFCVDCQQTICHLCAGISHRSCNTVVTVSEAAADRRASTKNWVVRMKKILSDSVVVGQAREKSIDNLEKRKAKAEEMIKAWSEEWLVAIRKEEMRLIQNLNKHYQAMTDKLALQLRPYDEKITRASNKISTLSTNGTSLSDFDILNMNITESELIEGGEQTMTMYRSLVERIKKIEIAFDRSPKPEVHIGDLVLRANNELAETSFTSSKTLEVSTECQGTVVYDLDIPSSILYSKDTSPKPPVLPKRSVSDAASRFKETMCKVLPGKSFASRQFQPDHNNISEASNSVSSNVTCKSYSQSNEYSQGTNEPETNDASPIAVRVRAVRSINAVLREDYTSPRLRDVLVFKPGNTVLATDWANHCVKAFFTRRDRDCRLTVGGKPWAITQLGESLAAVSLPLARQICVLKVTYPLMVQKSFQVSKNYSGLASLNSQTLVASGGSDPPSVDIINLYGEVLKSFSTNEQGNPLFIYPAYVCVTPSLDILVSDKKRGAVICLSHVGKVKYEFNPQGPKQLQEPCGISSTPSGHVLLLELRGLLKLTPRGQLERPLIRHQDGHVTNPRGIDVDSEGLIYVTTNEQEVTVFDVS